MPFLSLSPVNFRNLKNSDIDLSAKEIFFVGKNGQGKSNLLECLYYSAYASSFRTNIENEMIKKGENGFSIRTIFRENESNIHTTNIIYEKNVKKIEKDGKMIHDRKELINTMPCVLYNHDDLDFAIGSPERRRFFIDQSLTMYDVVYVDVLRRYKKILKNRNICLKEKNYSLLETYDFQIAQNGLEIIKKRKNAVFTFNQIFGKLYEQVTGISNVIIKYKPSWKKTSNINAEESFYGDINIPSIDDILEHLKSQREVEKIMCTTMSGPHRDKIVFERNKEPFVPVASTGQRRLLALILRNSQAQYYSQIIGKKPILLMDDVMLELDPEKREIFTSLLPEYDQLICTFLPGEIYNKFKREKTKVYEISEGNWSLLNE